MSEDELEIDDEFCFEAPLNLDEKKNKKKENLLNKFTDKELEVVDFKNALQMFLFENDKTECFAVRIKHVSKLELDRTFNHMTTKEIYSVVLVAEEGEGYNLHQHLLLRGTGLTKSMISDHIKELYPDCKGNKCFSISAARDTKQLLKYTLKEGEFLCKGIPEKVLSIAYKLSNPKTDLKKKLRDNEEALILGKISLETFTANYIQIKVDHTQPIYANHIQAYVTRMGMSTGKISINNYAQRIIDRIMPD